MLFEFQNASLSVCVFALEFAGVFIKIESAKKRVKNVSPPL